MDYEHQRNQLKAQAQATQAQTKAAYADTCGETVRGCNPAQEPLLMQLQRRVERDGGHLSTLHRSLGIRRGALVR